MPKKKVKAAEPLNVEIDVTAKTVQVSISFIGEGINGDYDPKNPKDIPLLRMDVARRGKHGGEDVGVEEWGNIRNGSFMIQMDARSPSLEIAEVAAKTASFLDTFPTSKRICQVEMLSHISSAGDIGTLICKEDGHLTMKTPKGARK